MAVSEGEGKKRIGGISVKGVDFEADYDQGLAQEALRPAVEDAVAGLADYADEFAELRPAASQANIVGANGESLYLDRGENFGIQVGQRFEVYRVVDEIKDAAGNVLDQVTDRVGLLEVTRVLSKSSVARIVEGEGQEGDQARSVSDSGQ